jgi:transposase
MMGKKAATDKLFYLFSLEEQVPADHLLRRVAEAVDFSFVRRMTARFYSHTGQPSVDPVVLFKMALLGYLYGITSERRLVQEIALNLAYRWFLGYDLDEAIPDHSVLSKARARFGPTVYLGFFTEIIRQCAKAGLVRGNLLYVDSTLVAADADVNRVGSRALVSQLPDIGEHVARIWEENPAPDPPGEGADGTPSSTLRVVRAAPPTEDTAPADTARPAFPRVVAPTRSAESLEPPPEPGDPPSPAHRVGPGDQPNRPLLLLNERVVSRTDPDAEVVQHQHAPADLYYKVHVGVDGGRARIVTAVEVTGGGIADEHLLGRVIREHEGNTGRTVQEVVADTKYGTISNYLTLEQRAIAPSIPLKPSTAERREVPIERFSYDPVADRFTCPEGKMLTRQGVSNVSTVVGGVIYRAHPRDCSACPLKVACCGEAQARTVFRANDQGVRERVIRYLKTRQARASIRRRKAWIETVFGDGKERRGLRRARFRGRDRVRIQAWMIATAQNIRQLARCTGTGPVSGAGACDTAHPAPLLSPPARAGVPLAHLDHNITLPVYLN